MRACHFKLTAVKLPGAIHQYRTNRPDRATAPGHRADPTDFGHVRDIRDATPAIRPARKSQNAAILLHPPQRRNQIATSAPEPTSAGTHWLQMRQLGGQNKHQETFFALACCAQSRRNQAIETFGVDLLCKLATISFDQPDTQHVQVVDLPACALPRRFLQPVIQLYGLATAFDLRLDNDFLVFRCRSQRFDGNGLVIHLRQRTGIGRTSRILNSSCSRFFCSGVACRQPGPTADEVMRQN